MIVSDAQARDYIMQHAPHFRASELECKCGCGRLSIETRLLDILEGLRENIGRPIGITSGFRCPTRNRAIPAAAKNSPHMLGMAVDISVKDSPTRHVVLTYLYHAGIRRIGIGADFIHFDVAPDNPPYAQDITWTYYPKI